ncbi:MAG: DUF2155 domain-containing protein [Micavibrio sp.]|nr:DUF2155 domain-containing protein [Micavibrio sp.]
MWKLLKSPRFKRFARYGVLGAALIPVCATPALSQATIDYPLVRLRSLDKVTARTMTFDANVGSTLKFGSIYIKVRACRKAEEMEKPEAAAFIQVWESAPADAGIEDQAEWVFSGWMFASSPGLSSVDHPIYDVWVLDCLQDVDDAPPVENEDDQALAGEGEIDEDAAPQAPDTDQERVNSEGKASPDEGQQDLLLNETGVNSGLEASPRNLP